LASIVIIREILIFSFGRVEGNRLAVTVPLS
jgi:hypothetical protein